MRVSELRMPGSFPLRFTARTWISTAIPSDDIWPQLLEYVQRRARAYHSSTRFGPAHEATDSKPRTCLRAASRPLRGTSVWAVTGRED